MKKTGTTCWCRPLAAIAFAGMIAVNALANLLPINGIKTGEVADAYANLFAPTAFTFAVWGVIYLLLTMHLLYRLGLFRTGEDAGVEALMDRTCVLFTVSCLANAAWIYAWQYRVIWLSMLLMIVLLVSLIVLRTQLAREQLTARQALFVRLPFSVYFGWITVAAIANMTVLLEQLGWDRFGLSEEVWTVLLLAVGTALGCAVLLRFRDAAYGAVLLWAFGGILWKHVSPRGFALAYPTVVIAAAACLVLLLAVTLLVLLRPQGAAKREEA